MREKIISYCNTLGLDTLGFIKCREFTELRSFFYDRKEKGLENEFEEEDVEKRINPFIYMEEGKTIISIAFPYLHNVDYCDNGFSVYTRGKDYHKVVKSYLSKICEYIDVSIRFVGGSLHLSQIGLHPGKRLILFHKFNELPVFEITGSFNGYHAVCVLIIYVDGM